MDLKRELASFAPGSVIAIQIGNHPAWPSVLISCLELRLIPLPLGQMEITERASALRTCEAAGLVQMFQDRLTVSSTGFETGLFEGVAPDFLKLTSGTTAGPRAIAFRTHQLVADCDNICETMGITPFDVNFGAIPFSHSYGFSNLITPLLCRGVPMVAAEDRLPRALLSGLAQSKATVFPGMPVFFQSLAEIDNRPPLPRLRLCISAGAPLASATARRFSQRFGLKIHSFYGSSECGGIAYDASELCEYEEGFAGLPMRNVVIDAQNTEMPTLISVRGAAVGERYLPHDDPKALGGGCFVPGDLVRITSNGLHLAGRVSDIINVAGRKLNPLEVERLLCEVPGVRNAVVFGVPSPLRNEEPVACVAADSFVTAADVVEHCRSFLSPWQVPRDIWLVEEIPFSERGKVSRREMASRYMDRVKTR